MKHLWRKERKPRCSFLMHRGLRAQRGAKGPQGGDGSIHCQERTGGAVLWWLEGHMQGMKLLALPQAGCSAPATRGGRGMLACHHTSLLGLTSRPFY